MKLDILSFDAVKDAETSVAVQMKQPDGSLSGITFNVIGKHAEPVQTITRKMYRQQQAEEALARRKGREPEPKSVDELEAQGIELAAARVVGWDGVKQEFDKELLKQALKRNPHWIEQIIDESNDDGNFTKAS